MILINDPVAGVGYDLEPETHTARKLTSVQPDQKGQAEGAQMARNQVFMSANGAAGTAVFTYKAPPHDLKPATEDLGTQTLEGLKVTGTRTTITIPAGAEGNEQPMQIVDERWYSPELQTNIKTVHSDPRMGQTVFAVTNVSRTNPDASLFQIPADYQVTEGERMPKVIIDRSAPAN